MKARVGDKARCEGEEWIVAEVSPDGAPSRLVRIDEYGFPILEVVTDASKVILIIYSVWEPLKRIVSDIWNAIFRRKKTTDGTASETE